MHYNSNFQNVPGGILRQPIRYDTFRQKILFSNRGMFFSVIFLPIITRMCLEVNSL